nr:MAG TPA: hypothetical protein [Caudoviricetes sp.]
MISDIPFCSFFLKDPEIFCTKYHLLSVSILLKILSCCDILSDIKLPHLIKVSISQLKVFISLAFACVSK